MKRSSQPPLGVKPRFILDEERIRELEDGIMRFLKAKWPIPMEMVEEYNELTDKLETETNVERFAEMRRKFQ